MVPKNKQYKFACSASYSVDLSFMSEQYVSNVFMIVDIFVTFIYLYSMLHIFLILHFIRWCCWLDELVIMVEWCLDHIWTTFGWCLVIFEWCLGDVWMMFGWWCVRRLLNVFILFFEVCSNVSETVFKRFNIYNVLYWFTWRYSVLRFMCWKSKIHKFMLLVRPVWQSRYIHGFLLWNTARWNPCKPF